MNDEVLKSINGILISTLNKKDSIINNTSSNINTQLNLLRNNLRKSSQSTNLLSTINGLICSINTNNTFTDPLTSTPLNMLNSDCCENQWLTTALKIPEIQNLTALYTSSINMFNILKSELLTIRENPTNYNLLSTTTGNMSREVSGFITMAENLQATSFTCNCLDVSSQNTVNSPFLSNIVNNRDLYTTIKNNVTETLNTANNDLNNLRTAVANKIKV